MKMGGPGSGEQRECRRGERRLALSSVTVPASLVSEPTQSDATHTPAVHDWRSGPSTISSCGPKEAWVLAEGSDSSETLPFVTFLPRRPAKWHRLVGIRVRE